MDFCSFFFSCFSFFFCFFFSKQLTCLLVLGLVLKFIIFLKYFRESHPYTYTPWVVWHPKHLHHISYHYPSSLQPIMERTGPSSRQISWNLLSLPQPIQLITRIPVIAWNYRRISKTSNSEQPLEARPDLQSPPSIGPYDSSYFRKTFQTPNPSQESSILKFLIHMMLRNCTPFSLDYYP